MRFDSELVLQLAFEFVGIAIDHAGNAENPEQPADSEAQTAAEPTAKVLNSDAEFESVSYTHLEHTTPDPITLNRLLGELADSGCKYAFMEVSSHSIAQKRISGLKFAGGIFTNLTRDQMCIRDRLWTMKRSTHLIPTLKDGYIPSCVIFSATITVKWYVTRHL